MIVFVCCVVWLMRPETIYFFSVPLLILFGPWNKVLDSLGIQYQWSGAEELEEAARDGLLATVGKIVFAASVYCTWQARNQRIFATRSRSVDAVLKDIENYVIAKFVVWSCKGNYGNYRISKLG